MDARLFLCVDGGGSKTEALLADDAGRVLGRGLSGGSNALSVGARQAERAVAEAVSMALGTTEMGHVTLLYLFIPGFSQCMPLPWNVKTVLESDSANAYFGALGQPGGIVLLAGTGSFAVSYDAAGRETSVGGWGPMLGDEGSGYDIGRRAVVRTLKDHDAGRPQGALGQCVLAHYGAKDASQLVHQIYHGGCDRKQMADLCPKVGELARQGDRDARQVLTQAAHALAELAVMLQRRLGLREAPAALLGGVSGLGDVLTQPLSEALKESGLGLRPPRFSPAVGGVLYTYGKLMGHMPDEALAERYHQSYQQCCKGETGHDDGRLF